MRKTVFKIIAAAFPLCFSGNLVLAQDTDTSNTESTSGWKKGGLFRFNFNQVSLNNWAAGGQSSIAGNVFTNLYIVYKGEKQKWNNYLDFGYGLTKQGNSPVVKSDDRLELNSKYGRNISEDWYYIALLNFRSQIDAGYNFPDDSVKISDFLAPGYVLLSAGVEYNPHENLTVFASPLTAKTTIVRNQQLANAGAFGVDPAEIDSTTGAVTTPGKNLRYEIGSYLSVMYKKEVWKNVSFQTKLDLFSNYLHNPQNIDVNWEVNIGMKINDYLTANIATQLIYDDDIDIAVDSNDDGVPEAVGPRTQFKEVFGLGLSFKF